jgi:hypothetical protein
MTTITSFEPKTGGENISEVKRVLANLEKEGLNFENLEEVNHRIENAKMIIKSQQENAFTHFNEAYGEYMNKKDEEFVKKAMQQNIVPLTLYKDVFVMVQTAKEMISWYMYLEELQSIMLDKQKRLLIETRGVKVLGQTLIEMKSYMTEKDKLIKEIVESKINHIQTVMMSTQEQLQTNAWILNKENTRQIMDGLQEISKIQSKTIEMLTNTINQLLQLLKSLDAGNLKEILKSEEQKVRDVYIKQELESKEANQNIKRRIMEKEQEWKDNKLKVPEMSKNAMMPTREASVSAKGNDLQLEKDDEVVNFDDF